MTSDAIVDSYLVKLVRDLTPVVLIVMMIVIAFEGYFIKHNADTVDALQAQNQLLSRTQAQQSVAFQTFLGRFTAEANYECTVLWYLNHANAAVPSTTPLAVCQVSAP